MNKLTPKIYIGTSGVVLPINKNEFPIEFRPFSRLTYYSSLFNSVEVNSTFYKLPKAATFTKWANEVSDEFTFSIKLSKTITHSPGLLYEPIEMEDFIIAASELAGKKGVVLIQFPAKITIEYRDRVESLLNQLRNSQLISDWRIAIEIRHQSWYTPAAYEMFNRFNTSLVFHDMPKSRTPLNQTANQFIYLRFHGPIGDYRGNYDDDFLKQLAERIERWDRSGKTVFVYFNNTLEAAYDNARTLQACLKHLLKIS